MYRQWNGLKAVALLTLLSAVIILVGSRFGPTGVAIAVVMAIAINGYVYINSDRLALRSMRAYHVNEAQQPRLYRIVRELSTSARQPMPRLYVSPTRAANAFATGRHPRSAVICCTEGLLQTLNERELRAVLAHELAHVRNRDTLIASVAGALAAVIMVLATFAFLLPRGEDDDGRGPVGALLLALVGPVAASLVQMAVSRSREYEADVAAARITGDPMGLASALRKLEMATRRVSLPHENRLLAHSHLMIVNPFRVDGWARLFSTHPPVTERIARLEGMAGYRR